MHWLLNIANVQEGEQILKVVNEGTAGARLKEKKISREYQKPKS